jgi:hypothetical protein
MTNASRQALQITSLVFSAIAFADVTLAADLGEPAPQRDVPTAASDQWSFAFTTYGWIPWMSGKTYIQGHRFDVDASPSQILGHLDWSTIPAWMSYAEARRGPIGLFNDIVYAKLSGSKNFAKELPGPLPPLTGGVSANFTQAIVEFGGAYEVWSGSPEARATAFDLLAGGRYWHQDANLSAIVGAASTVRSGSVNWTDPFIGARLRSEIAPGQAMTVRADVGGFGVGSDFSWQVLATYNWELCLLGGHKLDGYLGYKALSVDYSEGAYRFDVLQQGPVVGATLHF